MSTPNDKKRFLEALRTSHMVLPTCRKTQISKSKYYRWRQQDSKFAKAADAAIQEAIDIVNDVADSTIVNGVRDQDRDYTKFWLSHRHPAYAERLMEAGMALTKNDESESILEIFAHLKPKTRELLGPRLKKSNRNNHGKDKR